MKTPNSMIRLTVALTLILAMVLWGSLISGQALAGTTSFSYSIAEKHLSVKVEIHGDAEGIHQDHVERPIAFTT